MTMKRYLLSIFFFLSGFLLLAQIVEPVKWSFEKHVVTDTEIELRFKATMDHPWHIYAMNLPEDGPVSTQFDFDKVQGAELVGKIYPSKKSVAITKYDATFAMDLTWYEEEVVFIQRVKVLDKNKFFISGKLKYMCCDDQSCLPPKKEEFNFGIEHQEVDTVQTAVVQYPIAAMNVDSVTGNNDIWAPVIEELNSFGKENGEDVDSSISLWLVFLTGFVGGLLALFTPCVWPIIPMTVSFFLKRNSDKRKGRKDAIFYGFSIIAIYLLLGIFITLVFGASALNTLSTNSIFNLVFFGMLVVFAISFFGFFEITLPSSWSTALNNKAEKTSGIMSILLMASTLVIVSFSCTGPIIGTLLVEVSTSGSLLAPAIGMLGFAMALSVPFSLFALFPTWLNSMPRSGSWMNVIKVILAFLELGLALKFLSVADLTSGWGILSRELFIGIWIALSVALGLYFLGLIRFPHDSKNQNINWFRRILAVISFMFVAYLSCGYWGAPLKEISAFLPPMENTQVFHDYEEGLEYAEEKNMPVFVDFTGYGCVNCRKMEAAVFKDEEVEKLLSQFVVVNLYVDDRAPLKEPLLVYENGKPLRLETQGERWSYLQRMKFGANAQPYYVLLDNEAKPIAGPYAYDENISRFVNYLKSALANYEKRH